MRVDAEGRAQVSAPYYVGNKEIESFVRERLAWIHAQQRANANSLMTQAERASKEDIAQWKRVCKEKATPYFEQWQFFMQLYPSEVTYRNMKSRFGSCNKRTGKICINTRLALYPETCLEYVVVHELAHLQEANHGPAFKALLDEFLPDWRQRRKLLNSL